MGLGWRVLPPVGFKQLGDPLPVGGFVDGVGVVGGVGLFSQFEGRANGTERDLNRSTADLMAFAESPGSDSCSEGTEEVNSLLIRKRLEHGVHVRASDLGSDEEAPMVPIACPFCLSRIQDPIGNISVCSSEKTSEETLLDNWNSCQDASCVRG